MVSRVPQSIAGLSPIALALMLLLGGGPRLLGADNPVLDDDEAAIEALLHGAAEAFAEKNEAEIRRSFVENYTGPFRIPKAAQMILKQVVNGSDRISVDYAIEYMEAKSPCAVAVLDLDMVLDIKDGTTRNVNGLFLFRFVEQNNEWAIMGTDRIDTSWEPGPMADGMVVWEDEALQFPVPDGWSVYPVRSAEARKSAIMISPDLIANVGVGVIGLPLPVELSRIIEDQKGVETLIPGSKFISERPAKLSGIDGIEAVMHVRFGPSMVRVCNVLAMRGQVLYGVSSTVGPPEQAPTYQAAFERVREGFELTGEPEVALAGSTTGTVADRQYSNDTHGVSLTAPAGWYMAALDDQTVAQHEWLFAVSLKAPESSSTVIVGARDLPAIVPVDQLRQAEMGQMRQMAEDTEEHGVEDVDFGGLPGKSWLFTFTVGRKRLRREVFATHGKRLYFMIADALPPSAYVDIEDEIDDVVESVAIRTQ